MVADSARLQTFSEYRNQLDQYLHQSSVQKQQDQEPLASLRTINYQGQSNRQVISSPT